MRSDWVRLGLSLLLIRCTFAGFACLSSPCLHGVCIDDLNTTYSCFCIDGYTGVQCQTNWNECWSNPCQNGGSCVDGIAAFNCTCPSGFIGDLCEEDYNECESNPCLNNGSCIDGTNGYTCNCPLGYSGEYCEIDIAVCNTTNVTRCSNGGICVEGPGITFSCACSSGWSGFFCDTEIDECMSAPCHNGAVCVDLHADYACACLFGYTGKNCEEEMEQCKTNTCKNNALCLMEEGLPVCYCVPDYHGSRCQYQYDECQLGPRCLNGGACIDGVDSFTCSCPPNFTGVLCECLILGKTRLDCAYVSSTSYPGTTETTAVSTLPSTTPTDIFTSTHNLTTQSTLITTIEITALPKSDTTVSSIPTTTEMVSEATDSNETSAIFNISSPATETITTMETTSVNTEINSVETKTVSESATSMAITLTSVEETSTPFTSSTEILTEESVTSISPIVTSTEVTQYTTPQVITTSLSLTTLTTEESVFSTISEFETTIATTISQLYETSTIRSIEFDCSKPETTCQNGGTCILASDGYKCSCPYDAEGPLCNTSLGIVNAAFGGDSFLIHHIADIANISVQFTARTLSSNGLILYANREETFVALYLEGGHLKFIFSCGCQTMLLSELKTVVTNGYPMTVQFELRFWNSFQRCNATITVNNTLTMSGNQVAHFNKLVTSTAILYLGGLPQPPAVRGFPFTGFMGCIKNLQISGRNIAVFKEAQDGYRVRECTSLACLSNPCYNGGTCTPNGEKPKCKCKNGYQGVRCETSICDDNPCAYGATCLPYTGSGYICLCPFGKHGHFCENDLEISRSHFSSSIRGYSSFVAYPIPPGGLSDTMELSLKFIPTTMDQISILLFIGQDGPHDALSDHLVVSFVKGYVLLTWNLGSGPRRIFTSAPIAANQYEYSLKIGRSGRRAWLVVDNLGNITGRAPGKLSNLDVEPLLFLGGHSSQNFSSLPHDLPLHKGFAGCIYDVQLKSGALSVPLQTSLHAIGRAVSQCGTTECQHNACHNSGACLHHGGTFSCLCQDNWFGPLCSSKYNPCDYGKNNCWWGSTCVPVLSGYECDCPLGRTGKYCEKEETLSDVSLSGRRSFIAVTVYNLDSSKFTISLQLRPLSDRGLVLYLAPNQFTFLSLTMQSNLLELRILPGRFRQRRELLSIRSTNLLAIGVWYKIRFGKFGNRIYINVDNITDTGVLQNGDFGHPSTMEILLGGLPNLADLPPAAATVPSVPFRGCIRNLAINSIHIPLTLNNITKARNVADCDGTPCGGDSCENGGSCWLDSSLKPHCSCPEPYNGERCEQLPSCHERDCSHGGKCVHSQCLCMVGFTGVFCETAIHVDVPEFTGHTYLMISKPYKKRNVQKLEKNEFALNFTTVARNGMILWITKNEKFIGLGVENCHLKLVFSLLSKEISAETLPYPSICNGLWYYTNITINNSNIKVTINNSQFFLSENAINLENIYSGVIYLGGFPRNFNITTKTGGLFFNSFSGCIGTLILENSNIIRDISQYEGESVGTCNV